MIYFIGVIVSLLIQWLKTTYETPSWKTMFILVGISFAAALVYTYFSYLGMWELVAKILTSAGAFYAFIIKRFEEK